MYVKKKQQKNTRCPMYLGCFWHVFYQESIFLRYKYVLVLAKIRIPGKCCRVPEESLVQTAVTGHVTQICKSTNDSVSGRVYMELSVPGSSFTHSKHACLESPGRRA